MNWECPYCGVHTILINKKSFEIKEIISSVPGSDLAAENQRYKLITIFIACPNSECRKLTLQTKLSTVAYVNNGLEFDYENVKKLNNWDLLPNGIYKQFPDFIPESIRNDYKEACQIKELSPKASATLARRCLQGMIRDFWEITDSTLFKEIIKLKEKVEDDVWEAIDSLRQLGNIGAHMPKDINVIVDIENDEVNQLIGLIELLMEEWYINREKRKKRLAGIKKISDQKRKENNV